VQLVDQPLELVEKVVGDRPVFRKRRARDVTVDEAGWPDRGEQRRDIWGICKRPGETHLATAQPPPHPQQWQPAEVGSTRHLENDALARVVLPLVETGRGKKIMLDQVAAPVRLAADFDRLGKLALTQRAKRIHDSPCLTWRRAR